MNLKVMLVDERAAKILHLRVVKVIEESASVGVKG
jgi:hypothetical protein